MSCLKSLRTPQPKAKYAYLINTIGQDGADLSLQEPKTSQSSGAEDLFGSRRPLRKPKTSSEAEDFSVLGAEDLGAEDLSVFRSRRTLRQPKTP
ncbi:hypothetical protein L6452_38046 [Arctium lappa]|uniref:Uncharacterized protein n=1 Tax=Arctium lappa TaxID=4217 RepID=A0ACB8Y557_ARCLA|nr:hypothetical protein L6452_38046 [Arctium lappa]